MCLATRGKAETTNSEPGQQAGRRDEERPCSGTIIVVPWRSAERTSSSCRI
jgi:hypothetical protein